MSTGLSTIAQIEFDAQVKAAYQGMAMLRKHVRVKTGVIGSTTRFRRYARGVATVRRTQTDVTPMNTTYAEATATLGDWNAAEYTDKLDQLLTNVEERQVLATNIAGAIGRREDQMIIDALDAAGGVTIAASATGMTFAKIRRAQALFTSRAIPAGERKLIMTGRQQEELLDDPKLTSKDYVESYVLKEGKLPRICGFDIEVLDERDEGGLLLTGGVRTCFAFDKQAIGLAVAFDGPLEVNYIPEKTSWLSNQVFKAGAVAIDALGVVEIACTET
jgi:hypothetical protein